MQYCNGSIEIMKVEMEFSIADFSSVDNMD